MTFLNLLYNRMVLACFGFIYRIVHIYTDNGFVCGNGNNIKFVYVLKFLFLRKSGTRHTRKLVVQSEEVLEGDCGECF